MHRDSLSGISFLCCSAPTWDINLGFVLENLEKITFKNYHKVLVTMLDHSFPY